MGKTPALLRGGDRRHIAATGHSAWLCDTGVWGGCGGWQGGAFGPYNGPGTWSTTQKKCKKKCFQRGSNQSVVLPTADTFPFGHKRDAGICTNLRI